VPVALLELTTSGPDDTRAFAAALAPLLQPGDVVALSGDLGAGKTCFAQGAIRGLGVDARVTSPTFVLVRQYEGRLPIVHCDVYRLDRLQDVHELGDDVLAPEVVTFLEWADAVRPLLPDDRLEIELGIPEPPVGVSAAGAAAEDLEVADLEVADLEARRTVTVRGFGPRWAGRSAALTDAVRPWRHHDATQRSASGGTAPGGTAPRGTAPGDTGSGVTASAGAAPVPPTEPEDR